MDRRVFLAASASLLAPRPARAAVGFDEVATRARSLDQLHALAVARDGRQVFGQAFRGPGLGRVVNVKSVSKTLVAILTGIAIDKGVLRGADQPVAPFLERDFPARPDPRLARLTVDHLVTMRAGLERTSGANYGAWVSSGNWVRDALARPFVSDPGAGFLYSTGSFHLLGVVLARASGRNLHQLTRDWLARPLGIEIPPWTRDPQGNYLGGNNMGLSPEGLLRVGEVMRQGGSWNDRQIVSRRWIDMSWTARTRSPFSGDAYGYGWFITRLGGARAVYARGYGGQMLFVFPDRGISIAITSDPNRPARSRGHVGDLRALVAEAVLPALDTA